jgi:hypothetical protein
MRVRINADREVDPRAGMWEQGISMRSAPAVALAVADYGEQRARSSAPRRSILKQDLPERF